MMKKKNAIIITIGEKGTIFTIHDTKNISTKVFFKSFDEEVKKSLSEILSKNRSQNIYITFDTLDQSFKKKNFPAIKKSDLKLLIKREIDTDPDKDSLKSYVILEKINSKSLSAHSQVMFISSSIPGNSQDLIDFIYKLPNRLAGFYLSPIESISLINAVNKFENKEGKENLSESKINCLVTKTKVSGIRQTIYHGGQILFTRLLDYDSFHPDFIKRYEKDLYASFEYLKRIFPEIPITKFYITNILSKRAIGLISQMTNIEFNITNYEPYRVSKIIDPSFKVKETTIDSDLLISRSFFKSTKNVLKFETEESEKSQKIFFLMRFGYLMNLVILLAIGILSVSSASKISESEEMADVVKIKKINASNELTYSKKKLSIRESEVKKKYQGKVTGIKIIEIGEISKDLDDKKDIPFKEYVRLSFLKKHNLVIKNILYNVKAFDPKRPKKQKYSITIDADIINKSGDVDDLFIKYDNLKSELEKLYAKYRLSINELPKNINLARKYDSFTLKIVITSKK